MKIKVKFLLISVILIILSVLGIGVSYSLWNMNISQDKENVFLTKCFNVEITSQNNSISLENAYPLSNENGKKLKPFSFTVTNTCDIFASFTVNLESLKGSNLSSKYLNAVINNEEIKRLSDYDTSDIVNDDSIESHTLVRGSLGSGDSEDYTLRLWIDYDTTMEDLDNEIKNFKAKIVVKSQPSSWSPVNEGYDTLHDAILANEYQTTPEEAIKKIEAKGSPDLTKTAPVSDDDFSDKGLYKDIDDYGTTYYFRGNVKNNNVYFAGYYWQIVRINGDGSIRLLYNGMKKNASGNEQSIENKIYQFNNENDGPTYIGYMYGNKNGTTFDEIHSNLHSSSIKTTLDNWYLKYIENAGLNNYIADSSSFCGDRTLYLSSGGNGIDTSIDTRYGPYERFRNNKAIFTCKNINRDLYTLKNSNVGNKVLNYPIGLITTDELIFSGIPGGYYNRYAYTNSSITYWTFSPAYSNAKALIWANNGAMIAHYQVNTSCGVRPVINLKSDVKISSGIGTINEPFIVKAE